MENNKKRQVIKISVILGILLLIVGVSYALVTLTLEGTRKQVITAGTLSLELDEDENNLTIENAMPMYDEVGMIQDAFTFRIINNTTIATGYTLKLVDITDENVEKLDTSLVKYGLTKNGIKKAELISEIENGVIDSGIIKGNTTIEYELRLWINSTVEDETIVTGKSLSYKIEVEELIMKGTSYDVTFDTNGGNTIESKTYIYGESYENLPTPIRNGYVFNGWYTKEEELVTEETIVQALTDDTLYAKWENAQYTVTLDANGGNVSTTSLGVTYQEAYGTIPNARRTDYEFLGWYTSSSGGTKIESTDIYTLTKNQTLYAHWSEYKEEILNGAVPVLTSNLIPVTIASNGTVTKADLNSTWYDYNTQIWANAVVLSDNTINYDTGATIPETNIESYFVWIPRFRYKIFDVGDYSSLTGLDDTAIQTIEVEFESKDVAVSTGSTVGSWLTHPAFTTFNSNGFWVGKFETGYNGATTKATAQVNSSDSSKIIIKPNVYSWRNITVGNAFKASYDYMRDEDSHMMKNTEWGAVAYLQHSKYGSRASVRVNNNSSYITGYAAVVEPTKGYSATSITGNQYGTSSSVTLPYNTTTGYTASTTGNISGVYDMSGGAHDYVMGYNTKASTTGGSSKITTLYQDFFTNTIWEKYYDRYNVTATTFLSYNQRILGDATGEMGSFRSVTDSDGTARYRGSWYNDWAYFLTPTDPWFNRGTNIDFGVAAGVFAFNSYTGGVRANTSFRVVLTP